MSTIEKAVQLLNFFDARRAEIGLSEFQKLAGRDKATIFRHLSALMAVGLLEQNPATRRYRIGPAVLRLAHLRETSMPRRAGARDALGKLAATTGETAHASIIDGAALAALDDVEATAHSTRVVISDDILPLHATGSGLAVLAFAGPGMLVAAKRKLRRFTDRTAGDDAALDAAVACARATGFGVSDQGFETGVHGIGAPVFDDRGAVAGAIAVATPVGRMTPALHRVIRRALIIAARAVTESWGGVIPPALNQAWAHGDAAEQPEAKAAP